MLCMVTVLPTLSPELNQIFYPKLHGYQGPVATLALAHIDGDGESVSQSYCSKEHLNTDEEVLVARADGAWPGELSD